MPVTYDETLADNISIVRFNIGDTVENEGPRPGSRNYSDAEITALLDIYNDSTDAVTSSLFSTLASEWTKYAGSITVGPRSENLSEVSKIYEAKAKYWAGIAGMLYTVFSGGLVRRPSSEGSEHTA